MKALAVFRLTSALCAPSELTAPFGLPRFLVDLERNEPLELLPDRQASTVAAWLPEHPALRHA